MKKATNFGSRGRSKLAKKQNARKAGRVGFAVAVIAVLTVAVREIAVDYLKNLRDSVHSAESQFEEHSDQDTLQMQILIVRQQAENAAAKETVKDPDAEREFSTMIPGALSEVNEAKYNLNFDFESVSTLLGKLPPGFKSLRDQLPSMKTLVDNADKAAQNLLNTKTTTQARRYANTRLALAIYMLPEIPLAVLGGVTVAQAKKVEDAADSLIHLCNKLMYLLVAIGAGLGVYAAWLRIKADD